LFQNINFIKFVYSIRFLYIVWCSSKSHTDTLKKYFQVIAERLSEEEIGGLKELFKMIDTDNSGTITFEELKAGLKSVGSNLMESEIKSLMEAVGRLSLSLS